MSTVLPFPQAPDIHVTAVIVLYGKLPVASEAVVTLKQAAAAAGDRLSLTTLLVDNTPGGQDPGPLSGVVYRSVPTNDGLAAAYNWALAQAEELGSQWLLTLDQDTSLPEDFLLRMATVLAEVAATPVIGAVVPRITGGGKALSPYRFARGALPRWFTPNVHGFAGDAVFAFNSAAMLRVSVLRQIGGYHPWFWLDHSDTFLFRQLQRFGKQVFVAGEVQVDHDFSMLDLRNRASAKRYRNSLLAESAFWDLEMNAAAGAERTARLAIRLMRQWKSGDPAEQRIVTQDFLKRRLLWSRRRRLQGWLEETRRLFPALPAFTMGRQTPVESARPRVSVCMAAYNGGPYIELQLQSILHQLSPTDEIIIVDDASTDATVDVIRSLRSPVIRLLCHRQNRGVTATFEEALRNATGDILFLADGDDIWADDKVKRFLEAFERHPQADIVTSRVAFIDSEGNPIVHSMYDNRKSFQSGFWSNVLKNHFQGSAMAIRASLLGSVLPFPRDAGFLHDQWIATRNARAGGSAVWLDEPLLLYRRHSSNASGRLSRFRQLSGRLSLLWEHFRAAIKDFRWAGKHPL